MIEAFDPANLPEHKLRRLYDYWLARGGDGALPSRRDIDPLDIPELLPNIFLLDVVGKAEDFVFRLAGSLIEEAFGMPLGGKSVAAIRKIVGESVPVDQYAAVARGGGPHYREGMMQMAGREHWKIHRLLLPLSSDGESVDVLIGGAFFVLGDRINKAPAEPWSYARPDSDPPLGL